ncbi:MAG: hypothetical protein EOM54_14335 [Clostridia bacterium]|nr:hypothetical protein [Clostridia bacterium]
MHGANRLASTSLLECLLWGWSAGTDTAQADNPFRYCGEYLDSETVFYYLRARYYDPDLGRFTQEDTYRGIATNPLSLNLYTYCGNNPIIYNDPSGQIWETVFDIGGAIVSAYELIVNPSWPNFGFLLWDVGAALTPFVPGSYVAKGVKIAAHVTTWMDDAMELAQAGKQLTRVQEALVAIGKGAKLTNSMKAALRKEARILLTNTSSKFRVAKEAMGSSIEVHHIVPLEWAHLMGTGFDPNDINNLAGVNSKVHRKINSSWAEFDKLHPNPTKEEIATQVAKVNEEFGQSFIK